MREILFRGKRTDNGEWVYGYYIRYGWTRQEKDYIVPSYASDLYVKEVIPETVGQYTGLTDKNGKKIFEGDIVYSDDLYAEPLLVIFNENCGEFQALFNDGYSEGFLERYTLIYHLKVIGNIHDSPELLERNDGNA